jgi:hypothetical protein
MKSFLFIIFGALSADAFNVGKLSAPTEIMVHQIEDELLRHGEQLENFKANERTWLFPEDSRTRHSQDLPPMYPTEWRMSSKKNIITDDSVLDQTYKTEDRKWAFPDERKIRHSEETGSWPSPEVKAWSKPDPNLLCP